MRIDLKLYPVLTSFLIPTKHLCEPIAFGNGSEAKYAPHIISSPIPDWYWYGAVILPQVIPDWYVLQYHYQSTFTIPTEIKLFSINVIFFSPN
jgi:hypothetical protein